VTFKGSAVVRLTVVLNDGSDTVKCCDVRTVTALLADRPTIRK
jgi:hypothetical protein